MSRHVQTHSPATIHERLTSERPGWTFVDGAIRRVYETDGWPSTLMVVNALAYVGEAADHHPDLIVGWSRVEVRLSTHHAGGITDKDFELARRIEDTVLWRPGPDSALTGTSRVLARPAEAS